MISLRILVAPALIAAAAIAACAKVEVAPAKPLTVDLTVEGMTCSGCEETICSRVRELPGIDSCSAHFETGRVEVVYREGTTNAAQITDAVRSAGYTITNTP